jgi:hypothetical protein
MHACQEASRKEGWILLLLLLKMAVKKHVAVVATPATQKSFGNEQQSLRLVKH